MSAHSHYISLHEKRRLFHIPIAVAEAIHQLLVPDISESSLYLAAQKVEISVDQGDQDEYDAHAKVCIDCLVFLNGKGYKAYDGA